MNKNKYIQCHWCLQRWHQCHWHWLSDCQYQVEPLFPPCWLDPKVGLISLDHPSLIWFRRLVPVAILAASCPLDPRSMCFSHCQVSDAWRNLKRWPISHVMASRRQCHGGNAHNLKVLNKRCMCPGSLPGHIKFTLSLSMSMSVSHTETCVTCYCVSRRPAILCWMVVLVVTLSMFPRHWNC